GDHGGGRHAGFFRPRGTGRGPSPTRPSAGTVGPTTLGPIATAAARIEASRVSEFRAPRPSGLWAAARLAARREPTPVGAAPGVDRTGARGVADGAAAVDRARRWRDRRAYLSVARLRRLPATPRSQRSDHLSGHAKGPRERADSPTWLRSAADPRASASPVGKHGPDAYPEP